MSSANLDDFISDYFGMWNETDEGKRHAAIEAMWADSAAFHISPAGASFTGVPDIRANIDRVNKQNIQEAGFRFRHVNTVANHDSVALQWEMVDSGDQIVGAGRDFILRDADGRMNAVYMFMGL
ncbi:nuclear transport factor 2 family protein [Nocardia sp. CA-120079]|uniref:nuclear transport factor 2 family protein n=1 Tax=Nocardia sp. CA-120079 TaxID=3239974 RepID=UPI003D982062